MLRKIKLYGELAKFVGHKEFEVKADTLAHAVSFLINNFEGVEKYMSPKHYQVKVGNYAVDQEEILHPIGQADIHIVPVITGAGGNSPFGRILLGAALIGASFLFPGAGLFGKAGAELTGGVVTGFAAKVGTAISAIGAGLVLSGVSEMLFPLPKPDMPEDDPRISFSFSGVQNTSRAGTAHPIVYGEIVCGSVVISASVDTNQVVA